MSDFASSIGWLVIYAGGGACCVLVLAALVWAVVGTLSWTIERAGHFGQSILWSAKVGALCKIYKIEPKDAFEEFSEHFDRTRGYL